MTPSTVKSDLSVVYGPHSMSPAPFTEADSMMSMVFENWHPAEWPENVSVDSCPFSYGKAG